MHLECNDRCVGCILTKRKNLNVSTALVAIWDFRVSGSPACVKLRHRQQTETVRLLETPKRSRYFCYVTILVQTFTHQIALWDLLAKWKIYPHLAVFIPDPGHNASRLQGMDLQIRLVDCLGFLCFQIGLWAPRCEKLYIIQHTSSLWIVIVTWPD